MSTDQEFAAFAAERLPALLRYAHLLTGDRARAEDPVQTAFAAAYRRRRRIDPATAEAYVREAVLNAYPSRWNRARPRERVTDRPPDRPVADGAAAAGERDAMWAALATLPPRQRAVLVLRHYEDLSEAETARVLDISPGTVMSQAASLGGSGPVDIAGPGQVAVDESGAAVAGGLLAELGSGFPTGRGRLTLADAAGSALPPVELPAYS